MKINFINQIILLALIGQCKIIIQTMYYNKIQNIETMKNSALKSKEEQQRQNIGEDAQDYQQESHEQDNRDQLSDNHRQNYNYFSSPNDAEKKSYRNKVKNGQNSERGQKINGGVAGDNENGMVGLNRKRREIKMEREELTQLFCELIKFVNEKVNEIGCLNDNETEFGKNIPILKNKGKSTKVKKEEEVKEVGKGPKLSEEIVSIPRKQSIKQQRFQQQKVERSRKKQQILQNYEKIMSYRLENEGESVEQKYWNGSGEEENMVPSKFPNKNQVKNNKMFCVVQEVSLIINPIEIIGSNMATTSGSAS